MFLLLFILLQMEPVVQEMSSSIDNMDFKNLSVPIIQDASAHAVENAYEIRQNLKQQLTGPVKWVDTVLLMEQMGVDYSIEAGPKNVLKALVEKISRNVESDSVKVSVNA
jgi:[acyl-carrier-protein] S-malonyltransferase